MEYLKKCSIDLYIGNNNCQNIWGRKSAKYIYISINSKSLDLSSLITKDNNQINNIINEK